EKEAVAENGADRLALLRSRRSDDRADRAQPARADRVAPPFADARGDSRVERLTSAVEVLELGGGGIRRPHEDEEPLAAVADSLEPGLHAVAPRVRVERHGIRTRPERVRRVAKESLGIGASRVADVAALRIEDHQEFVTTRDLRDAAQHVPARRAEAL